MPKCVITIVLAYSKTIHFFLRGVGLRPVKHRQFNYLYNVQLEIKVFNNIFSLLKKGNLFLIWYEKEGI